MNFRKHFQKILKTHRSDKIKVYLIHLETPITRSNGVHVQHYCGSTNDLERREHEHRSGHNGSPLLNLANQKGIKWAIVQAWNADRTVERWIKQQKNAARYCPKCQGVPLI